MLSAPLVSSVPPHWLCMTLIWELLSGPMIHTCVNHVFDESKWRFTCIWGLSLLGCVRAGWQMMGGVSSSWGNSEACLWVHNRAPVPVVIGNNSPSSPGSSVVDFGLEGNPLWALTAVAVCATDALSETGNEWKKEAETTLCCQTTGLIEVWAGSHRCSISHQGKKDELFLSQSLCKMCSQGTMQFLSQHPKGWNYTRSPCGAKER